MPCLLVCYLNIWVCKTQCKTSTVFTTLSAAILVLQSFIKIINPLSWNIIFYLTIIKLKSKIGISDHFFFLKLSWFIFFQQINQKCNILSWELKIYEEDERKPNVEIWKMEIICNLSALSFLVFWENQNIFPLVFTCHTQVCAICFNRSSRFSESKEKWPSKYSVNSCILFQNKIEY